jgi:hypothetical protein
MSLIAVFIVAISAKAAKKSTADTTTVATHDRLLEVATAGEAATIGP